MAAEKNFENKIKKYIEAQGGWQVKFFANSFTKSGIPDILCCINGYFLAIEVKAKDGKASDLQIHQCNMIRQAGGSAYVVFPSGWDQLKEIIQNLKNNIITKKYAIVLR
jgi:Holliday junction resolvase